MPQSDLQLLKLSHAEHGLPQDVPQGAYRDFPVTRHHCRQSSGGGGFDELYMAAALTNRMETGRFQPPANFPVRQRVKRRQFPPQWYESAALP